MTPVVKDGERRVMLDRERTLRMDFNALVKAEELTGKNFIEAETWANLSATDYRALTWACLQGEDQSLTLDQVGHMMTRTNEKVIADALLELYIGEASTPIDEKKDGDKEPLPLVTAGGGDGQ